MAITGHDTTAGTAVVREEIPRSGLALNLIPGVEMLTVWGSHKIHIAGLNIDIAHPVTYEFPAQQTGHHQQHACLIAERLDKAHIPGAWEGALCLVGGGATTRGHSARSLVECGKATAMADVFKKYLACEETGYVPPQQCTIGQVIDVIHHPGDEVVPAHPGRHDLNAKWLKRLVAHSVEHRGDTTKVAQCQQSPNERAHLAILMHLYQLWVSQGSDFHLPCPWIELGRRSRLSAGIEGIWRLQGQPEIAKRKV